MKTEIRYVVDTEDDAQRLRQTVAEMDEIRRRRPDSLVTDPLVSLLKACDGVTLTAGGDPWTLTIRASAGAESIEESASNLRWRAAGETSPDAVLGSLIRRLCDRLGAA